MYALEGLRVLDFGDMLAGPYVARTLGDLGATVIKIEPPEGGLMRPKDDLFSSHKLSLVILTIPIFHSIL